MMVQDITWNKKERRSGVDRRRSGLPAWWRLLFTGARARIRRKEDRQRFFLLDRYSTPLFVTIVSILFLTITDAFLTLILIDHGASEINPVMAYFLGMGPLIFLMSKYLLTSISVFVLVIFSQILIYRTTIFVSRILSYACIVFSTVIVWELYLYYRFVH
jgi:hypothetical protein